MGPNSKPGFGGQSKHETQILCDMIGWPDAASVILRNSTARICLFACLLSQTECTSPQYKFGNIPYFASQNAIPVDLFRKFRSSTGD
jgi:hypothetical protein